MSVISSSNKEWEIRDAADTVLKAQRIKRDKKLYAKVKAELKRRRDDINKAVK